MEQSEDRGGDPSEELKSSTGSNTNEAAKAISEPPLRLDYCKSAILYSKELNWYGVFKELLSHLAEESELFSQPAEIEIREGVFCCHQISTPSEEGTERSLLFANQIQDIEHADTIIKSNAGFYLHKDPATQVYSVVFLRLEPNLDDPKDDEERQSRLIYIIRRLQDYLEFNKVPPAGPEMAKEDPKTQPMSLIKRELANESPFGTNIVFESPNCHDSDDEVVDLSALLGSNPEDDERRESLSDSLSYTDEDEDERDEIELVDLTTCYSDISDVEVVEQLPPISKRQHPVIEISDE